MRTAKIFQSGNSQAVRIPKEFKLDGDKVEIRKRRNALVLSPTKKSWAALIERLEKFTDDFMKEGRKEHLFRKETDPSREGAARHEHLHLHHPAASHLCHQ
jgi:antitoxin VapB